MTRTLTIQIRVHCDCCSFDLTHRIKVHDDRVIRVPPCDCCIKDAELRACREADKQMDELQAEIRKLRDAPPQT